MAAEVAYRVLGEAPSPWLVITHGLALDHREFLPFAEAWSKDWRVLLWDMPGHGESQPFPPRFSLEVVTDAFEALLTELGVERAVFVGFSFGGMATQALARRRPDLFRSLVAYGCFAPFSQPPLVTPALVGTAVRLAYLGKSWPMIQAEFAARCALSAAGQDAVRRAMAPLDKPRFLRLTKGLLAAFRPDPAFRAPCPLFLLRGADDSNAAALAAASTALRRLHPPAREILVPGAGHCAHLDAPAAFRDAIEPFLAETRARIAA